MMSFKKFLGKLKKREGISREQMPQIPKEKYQEFIDFARSKGIIVEEKINVKYPLLSIIQNTFKDLTYEELKNITDMTRPLIISKDYYIIDGHHRFLVGLFEEHPAAFCTMINLNVNDALDLALEFSNLNKE